MSNKSGTQNPHIIDSDQEDDLIVLAYEDVSEGIQACTRSLSGRIFSDRIFSVGTMEGALYAIWNKPEGFRVVEKSKNQFQFFFENDSDVTRIERGSPWLFKSFVIHVRRWKQSINMEDNHISSFPVWAQFWGLPEQYKTLEVGRKLGGRLGQIEDVALFEVRGKDTRIVKAKVELNGDKRVRDTLKLLDPNQKMLEIGVRYERIGVFCTYCAKLGHESKNCQCFIDDSTQNNIKEDRVGEWLKADQVGRRLTEKKASFNPNQPRDGSIPTQPKKKSPPAWLFDSFSKMNVQDDQKKQNNEKIAANSGSRAENEGESENTGTATDTNSSSNALLEISYPMNNVQHNNNVISKLKKEKKKPNLKQLARKSVIGFKRRSGGNSTEDISKKICLNDIVSDAMTVEGASLQVAPKEI